MRKIITTTAALLATTTSAMALGLDRSAHDIGVIFEEGTFAELSFSHTNPNVTGVDALGNDVDNIAGSYNGASLGYKTDLNDQFSLSVIIDQPYGANTEYGGSTTTTMLGGTAADLDSMAVTVIGRYKLPNGFSLHGGLRGQSVEAEIATSGAAWGGLNGYKVELDRSTEYGYLIGAAYERPEIALRIALTYFSAVKYEFDSTESVGGTTVATGKTKTESPESINLDFQTGIAENTLLFGSIRHAKYSDTKLTPTFWGTNAGGASLIGIDDGNAFSLGVAYRFNDQFAGIASIGYEPEGDSDLLSPLAPTNGNRSITLGGRYNVNDQVTITGGVRYTKLGDGKAETSDTARATFTDNDALSVGVSVGYRF